MSPSTANYTSAQSLLTLRVKAYWIILKCDYCLSIYSFLSNAETAFYFLSSTALYMFKNNTTYCMYHTETPCSILKCYGITCIYFVMINEKNTVKSTHNFYINFSCRTETYHSVQRSEAMFEISMNSFHSTPIFPYQLGYIWIRFG